MYRVPLVLPVLVSLLRLLLSLQFDLHGVADQASEDGLGLGCPDERMLKEGNTKESTPRSEKATNGHDGGARLERQAGCASFPPMSGTSCHL